MRSAVSNLWRWSETAGQTLLDLLLPPRCRSCDADMLDSADRLLLCRECRERIVLNDGPACPRCAAPLPSAGGADLDCVHCRLSKLRMDRTFALGRFEGLLHDLIVRMKSDAGAALPRLLADLSWQRLGADLQRLGIDVVAPVPRRNRLGRRRGVGLEAAAERIARRLRTPFDAQLLQLGSSVAKQVGLSRAGRFANVAGQMSISPGRRLSEAHVLVVDDTLTTGATCSEAARSLRKAGAAEVTALVFARTPDSEAPPRHV
jgi:predicted amidophosphoribosyltransferase